MTQRFNPPPNWPRPPAGWTPEPDWRPDPRWGPPPPGWFLWVEDGVLERPDPQLSNPGTDAPRVFISYRRADCQPQANGLYDGLSHRLPGASIFMDLDSIPPGADFEQHIRQEIQICDLVLVMIGDNWLDEAPEGGGRRIDQPDDFVRLEIESALASPGVRVIPVLVEGARMPAPAQLPDSIRSLTRYNALELDDRRWSADVGRLAATIASMTRRIEPGPAPEHAKEPVPGPPSPARATNADSRSTSRTRTPLIGWIMIALPVLTFGFADFVPALWAANRRPRHRRFRLRMLTFAVLVGLLTYVSIGVVGSIASNPSLTWLTNVAVALWFGCIAVATVVAVLTRKSKFDLPGTAEELQRRRERERYRNLIRSDITLARSMAVGRPDLSRTYSDGGLLDLNSLSPEALARFCPMPFDEAQAIVVVRQRRGRFLGIDDVAAQTSLSEPTLARLRETAVFL